MSQAAPEPGGDGQVQPAIQERRQHGWRRTILVAPLVAAMVLVGAGGAGFAAGRVLAGGGDPVRCATWESEMCIPGLDIDAVLSTLTQRGFECESHTCTLAEYRAMFAVANGQVHSLSASVSAVPGGSLTPHQEAYLSWMAVLPFAGQPESAEVASRWLSEQLASDIDGGPQCIRPDRARCIDIEGYDYSLDRGAGRLELEIQAGFGGWFR